MRILIRKATDEDVKNIFSITRASKKNKSMFIILYIMVFDDVNITFLSFFLFYSIVTISSACCLFSALQPENHCKMIFNSTCSYPLIHLKLLRACAVCVVSAVHVCFSLSFIFIIGKLFSVCLLSAPKCYLHVPSLNFLSNQFSVC